MTIKHRVEFFAQLKKVKDENDVTDPVRKPIDEIDKKDELIIITPEGGNR